MAKDKIAYVCSNCGQESSKWIGKCPSCGQWNTFKEIRIANDTGSQAARNAGMSMRHGGAATMFGGNHSDGGARPVRLRDISAHDEPRIDMHDGELNRVLGGGLVPGSITLLGGEPGIGKSTLTLQTILHLPDMKVMYVSGEESAHQIKLRADRLASASVGDESAAGRASLDNVSILCETSLEKIFTHIQEPVSYTPKILEHIVDTVVQFEGDQHYMYRILRSIKNRFGSTSELGIYEMQQGGLRQVSNPSELLLTDDHDGLSGVAISSAIEGVRPFLVETQALVSTAAYGTPQRSATGFDQRRLNMLLAVLEKRVGFKLMQKDVFLNIAGGLRVTDLAMDLSVIAAVLSSNVDTPIEAGWCMAGEVGLSGEVRPVSRIEQRIAEAEKLGFHDIIIPRYNYHSLDRSKYSITIHPVRKVEEALRCLFG